jgi:very-short-patch-repair endonuclease
MAQSVDQRIAELAKRQGGHITRAELLAIGLAQHEIAYRIEVGRLIRVYHGVYAVGRLPTTVHDQAAGALLACGPSAVLSHSSAAALWGITATWRTPFEITITGGDRRPKALRVHRVKSLPRADVTRRHGLAVTTAARSALDIAPADNGTRAVRVVNDLRHRRLLTLGQLAAVAQRHPRHPGVKHVAAMIAEDHGYTQSELEDRFPDFVKRHGFPQPRYNTMVAGYRVDVYFPVQRVIVELDGYEFHRTRESFESDRARDAKILAAAEIPTMRITGRRMRDDEQGAAAELQAVLAARRPRPEPSTRVRALTHASKALNKPPTNAENIVNATTGETHSVPS